MEGINISKLDFKYDDDNIIFSNASLQVQQGEVVCIVGENGSGKSTLLKILANIIPCNMELNFFNEKKIEMSKVIKDIGYIPDKSFLYDELTGSENINYIMNVFCEKKQDYLSNVMSLCEKFNLTENLDSKVKNYSLGMRHKLFLAAILSRDIKVILLDEPLTALDAISQGIAKEQLKQMAEMGKIVIFTSHIKELQNSLATRIYTIKDNNFVK